MRLQTFIFTLAIVAAFSQAQSQAIAQSVTPVYDTLNRVTSVQSTAGTATLSQDAAGNLYARGFTPDATAINGQCGAANGVLTVTRPSAFLCAAGTSPGALSGTGPWTWSCNGINGGTNVTTCAAPVSGSPNCLSISGSTAATLNGIATYTATCVNTSAYVWRLNNVRIVACDNLALCTITFLAVGANTVNVSPTGGASVSIPVTVSAPTGCSAISGPTAVVTGDAAPYVSTCSITATRVWKLNAVQIVACNDLQTCAVTMTTLGANTLTVAPTATSAANITATLAVTASAPAPTCSEVTGSNVAPAAGASQSYTAICANASSYVWKLGSTTVGCTTATCAVSIAANASPTQVLRTLTVAPSTATASTAALIIAQAPAAVAPQCTGSVTGQTAYPYTGGSSSYSVTCTGASSVSWVLGGIAQSCAGTTCTVVVPASTSSTATSLSLVVTATNLNGSTGAPTLSITVAATPACSLDFNGDGSVDTTDALIFNRWLFGFRGDSLVAGITAFPVGTPPSVFATAVIARMAITSVHDFDQDAFVKAETDGLIFLRMTQTLKGSSVTSNALGAGAQRNTYELIRTHINTNCGTSFAP